VLLFKHKFYIPDLDEAIRAHSNEVYCIVEVCLDEDLCDHVAMDLFRCLLHLTIHDHHHIDLRFDDVIDSNDKQLV